MTKNIDWILPNVSKHPILGNTVGTRKFYVDEETCDYIVDIFNSNKDLFNNNVKFARNPFEKTLIKFNNFECFVKNNDIYVLYDGTIARVYYSYEKDSYCDSTPGIALPANWNSKKEPQFEIVDGAKKFTVVFFLLLHAPRGVSILDKPAYSKIVKGKRKAYAAHHTVKIHLTKQEVKRVLLDGSKGWIRGHEVRGHWAHWNRVRGCEHKYISVDVKKDAPERWVCNCGTIRVWKNAYQRGDATKGYVTHDYQVVA